MWMMDDDIIPGAIVSMCDKNDLIILHNPKVMQDDQLRSSFRLFPNESSASQTIRALIKIEILERRKASQRQQQKAIDLLTHMRPPLPRASPSTLKKPVCKNTAHTKDEGCVLFNRNWFIEPSGKHA